MIRPGTLRHRIFIQAPQKVDDGMGGHTETWGTVFTRQASIWSVKGKEKIIDGKLAEETIWNVRIRYTDGLNTKMKIVISSTGTEFKILSIIPSEFRREYIDMICRHVT